jgi:hypothetical protein
MSTYQKRVEQMRRTLENAYHEDLMALRARTGPSSVINGHMPLAANEVAQLRRPVTLRQVMTTLVNLGGSIGFVAFVMFLMTRAVS